MWKLTLDANIYSANNHNGWFTTKCSENVAKYLVNIPGRFRTEKGQQFGSQHTVMHSRRAPLRNCLEPLLRGHEWERGIHTSSGLLPSLFVHSLSRVGAVCFDSSAPFPRDGAQNSRRKQVRKHQRLTSYQSPSSRVFCWHLFGIVSILLFGVIFLLATTPSLRPCC